MKITKLANGDKMEHFQKAENDLRTALELYKVSPDANSPADLRALRKSAFAFWKVIVKVYFSDADFLQGGSRPL